MQVYTFYIKYTCFIVVSKISTLELFDRLYTLKGNIDIKSALMHTQVEIRFFFLNLKES